MRNYSIHEWLIDYFKSLRCCCFYCRIVSSCLIMSQSSLIVLTFIDIKKLKVGRLPHRLLQLFNFNFPCILKEIIHHHLLLCIVLTHLYLIRPSNIVLLYYIKIKCNYLQF